jgi:hypothetical protein
MLGMVAGLALVMTVADAQMPAAGSNPIIWWRTAGAQVVETHDKDGRTCSLIMEHDPDTVVFRWHKPDERTIYVRHPGWNCGDQKSSVQVQIQIGDVPVAGGAASDGTNAIDYKDWVMAPIAQPIASALLHGEDIRVSFPGRQAEDVTVPINRGRIAGIVAGVQRCTRTIGFPG